MLSNDAKAMIQYINEVLNNKGRHNDIPEIAKGDADFLELKQSLQSIRNVAEALRDGNVHYNIPGSGFVLDSFQQFQQAVKRSNQEVLKNITTKSLMIMENNHLPAKLQDGKTIRKLKKKISDRDERHRLMTENACDIIATLDLAGNFTYISPSVEKITGYTPEEVLHHYREIGYYLPGVQKEMDKRRARLKELVKQGERFDPINFEQRQVRKDGVSIYTDTVVSGIYDEDNQFRELLAISRDITQKVKIRRDIKKLSETDKLTGLDNRLKLDQSLEKVLDQVRNNAAIFALIMIDIDHFKEVNDCFGHLTGDAVLVALAGLLKNSIRAMDLIGRWGGEEFLVILPDTDATGAMKLAEKLRRVVSENHFPQQQHITISLGVSVFDDDTTVDSVIYRADQALYQAKENGKNRVHRM